MTPGTVKEMAIGQGRGRGLGRIGIEGWIVNAGGRRIVRGSETEMGVRTGKKREMVDETRTGGAANPRIRAGEEANKRYDYPTPVHQWYILRSSRHPLQLLRYLKRIRLNSGKSVWRHGSVNVQKRKRRSKKHRLPLLFCLLWIDQQ